MQVLFIQLAEYLYANQGVFSASPGPDDVCDLVRLRVDASDGVDRVSRAVADVDIATADCCVVDASIASVIAICGTLLGSAITYLFQRLGAGRSERFASSERLRHERLAAYSAFAGAVTELRRGVISLWFRLQDDPRGGDAVTSALVEADRLGAVADHARFRVQLVAEDPVLVTLADAAFEPVAAIRRAADRKELVEHERQSHEAVAAFIAAASAQVR
jgi:hypothetical protein